ncbi:hypothetical protein TNCV_3282771 [Trichonephila clavipes]|nr:hypothetical protein TNCV_3282771 [Trichonephila clavipes]
MRVTFVLKSRRDRLCVVLVLHFFLAQRCSVDVMLQRHVLQVDMLVADSFSLFICVKLPTILLLYNHLSNLSGKLSEFLEIGSYLWNKIIVLDDDSDIIDNST